MEIEVCNGCDACGLRCAAGVPATADEWQAVNLYIESSPDARRKDIERVTSQDKTVSLGDDVSVQMCRYRDMEHGRCAVYPVRPLVCRLLGHVEWMPCPIEKVPRTIPTDSALELMRAYAAMERRPIEQWEEQKPGSPASVRQQAAPVR